MTREVAIGMLMAMFDNQPCEDCALDKLGVCETDQPCIFARIADLLVKTTKEAEDPEE